MKKNITARHFQLREDAKNSINERVAEIESEYRSLTSARVILDHQKVNFLAEIVLHGRNIDIEAKGKGTELMFAFDQAYDKAMKQLRRHYDKIKEHKYTPISQLECEISEQNNVVEEEEEEFIDV